MTRITTTTATRTPKQPANPDMKGLVRGTPGGGGAVGTGTQRWPSHHHRPSGLYWGDGPGGGPPDSAMGAPSYPLRLILFPRPLERPLAGAGRTRSATQAGKARPESCY